MQSRRTFLSLIKLNQFCRTATCYDKPANTFSAAIHPVPAFLIAKNS